MVHLYKQLNSKSDEQKLATQKINKTSLRNVSICVASTQYTVVRNVSSQLQWHIVNDEQELWNVNWIDFYYDTKAYQRMKRFQRVNRFPEIQEITRKDFLCRNLMRMRKFYAHSYDFFPESWIFPADFCTAQQYLIKNPHTIFILKPENGAKGNGISMTKSLTNVDPLKRMICQTYINKPFLMDGFKFDLRVYVLVTSVDPLRIYVYNEGLVRLATKPYKTFDTSGDQKYVHLTNYSINKSSDTFSGDVINGSKRTISSMNKHLKEKGVDVKKIWSRIDDLIVKTFISALPMLQHSYRAIFPFHDVIPGCFELLGFDIILDEQLKPYLLEVNHSPSFFLDEAADQLVKVPLIYDTLRLLHITPDDKLDILREDKMRALSRHQQTHRQMDRGAYNKPKIPEERWLQNVRWEEEHLGNYRLIMPNPESSSKYEMFSASLTSFIPLYAETVISKKRAIEEREGRAQNADKKFARKDICAERVQLKTVLLQITNELPISLTPEKVKGPPIKTLLKSKKHAKENVIIEKPIIPSVKCKECAKEKPIMKLIMRKPSGFTPRKWSTQAESIRVVDSVKRNQSIEESQIKTIIYDQFDRLNLISPKDIIKNFLIKNIIK